MDISARLYLSKVYLSKIKTHYLGEIISDELELISTQPLCTLRKTNAVYHMTSEILEDSSQVVLLSS